MDAVATENAKKFIAESGTQGKCNKEINVDNLARALTSLPNHPKYELWCKPAIITRGETFFREFHRLLDGPDLLTHHKEALSMEEEETFLLVISYQPYANTFKVSTIQYSCFQVKDDIFSMGWPYNPTLADQIAADYAVGSKYWKSLDSA